MIAVILAIVFLVALWRIGTGLHRLAPKPEAPPAPTWGDKVIPLPICFAILAAIILAGVVLAQI